MKGNFHVRFLGGKAPVRELTYPARGQYQSGVAGRFGGLQFRPLSLRGQYLRAADDYPREQRDGAQPRNALPSAERLALGRQPERVYHRGLHDSGKPRPANIGEIGVWESV